MLGEFVNQYQLSKTLRFGATLKDYEKKCKSHEELKEFVNSTYNNLKNSTTIAKRLNEKELVKKCELCYNEISKFYNAWKNIYYRTDQIAIYKDFYRQLSRKARFDAGKQNSQLITLASLNGKYQDLKLSKHITNYWKDNIARQERLLKDFSQQLHQYKRALEKSDKAHTKPNLINFNKTFSILANLVNEVVIPLSNGAISFPNISKLEDGEESHLIEFALKDYSDLVGLISELKDAIATNGGYTPFAKVTLNRYTAEQKPHIFKDDIDNKIRELKLVELVGALKDKSSEQIEAYFFELDKFKTYNDKNQSVIVRTQCFKYKPIPFLVKHQLAEYIATQKGWSEDDVVKVLDAIGTIRSPAYDYAKNQEAFDLNRYPIKVAFDYAWEQLANAVYTTISFPEEMCREYLNAIYGCEVSEEPVFRLYADLLYIRKNLAVLDDKNNPPSNPEEFIYKIRETFENIKLPYNIKNFETYKTNILGWINDGSNYSNYTDAKKELGLIRGGLKGSIKAVKKERFNKKKNRMEYYYENPYTKLTNEFKNISSTYGKTFAELRDKFKEKNEITKITHFGIIVEDKNLDKYLLANELRYDNTNQVEAILNKLDNSSEFTTYQVKSLTSKTLIKLIKNHTTSRNAKSPYADFHTSKIEVNWNSIKQHWDNYKSNPSLLEYVKDCLVNSTMAKNQKWAEFGWDFTNCNSYEDIEHEIDQKSYILQKDTISKASIESLIKSGGLLLPIINQDITSKERKDKNQFSKDWRQIFEGSKEFRLHPEFAVSYRTPIEDYPIQKRYGRLQFICAFNAQIVPQNGKFINLKKQIEDFNDEDTQKRNVAEFNNKINKALSDKEYVVIGIDRGLKQLATLCVLDKRGKILGDFEIYKKEFAQEEKQWKHTEVEIRHILDLSNLRVETTVEGKKVLVDQSLTLVKKNRDTPNAEATEENRQKVKLKQLSYIRKLQYVMQTNEQDVLNLIKDEPSDEEFTNRIKGVILPYGEGKQYADIPLETMREMISDLQKVVANGNNQIEKNKIIELDAADNLKQGVVANMIGVVNFILAKYNYEAYLSLEDLSRAYFSSTSGYDGRPLSPDDVNFKEQQNQMLAGLGTYQFFEIQLLKKLQKIQNDERVLRFVPAFRSADNYRNILKLNPKFDDTKYVHQPFGIVHFVDPKFTSKKCPICGKTNVYRDKNDILVCRECGFRSDSQPTESENNLHYIHNGDDNGAYHIALKSVKNLKHKG